MQQHLWSREEVLAELADERIVKYIGWSDDRPVGLGMITRHLELVPMISPTFLRRRFPDQADRNAIFYGVMIFVRPEYRGKTMFARLGTHMAEETAQAGGVVLFDVCSFNRENGSLDQNLGRLVRPFPHSSMSMVDQQTWFAIELPETITSSQHRSPLVTTTTTIAPAADAMPAPTPAEPPETAPRAVDVVVDQLVELASDDVPALRAHATEQGLMRRGRAAIDPPRRRDPRRVGGARRSRRGRGVDLGMDPDLDLHRDADRRARGRRARLRARDARPVEAAQHDHRPRLARRPGAAVRHLPPLPPPAPRAHHRPATTRRVPRPTSPAVSSTSPTTSCSVRGSSR